MIRNLLKVSLLFAGYSISGIGLLSLIIVVKFMLDVLPELLMALVFGTLLTLFGFWILGKYEQVFKTKRDKWYSDRGY